MVGTDRERFLSMSMEARFTSVYTRYCGFCSSFYFGISQRVIDHYKPLVKEINNFLWENRYSLPCPQKIKFSKRYKRRDIVRIFSEIGGLKVIRYTNEYGKTIVHFNFEDVSVSQ